jgi:hypothetical protein
VDANFINAAGEITGQAVDLVTGDMPAILMIPCSETTNAACQAEAQGDVRIQLSQHQRDVIRRNRHRAGIADAGKWHRVQWVRSRPAPGEKRRIPRIGR